MIYSLPWLIETNLRPGLPVPSNTYAPRTAVVVNSEVLKQQQSQLASRTFLQVIDIQETARLNKAGTISDAVEAIRLLCYY